MRMAVEEIGMADPRAMEQAMAGMQTAHFLGIPEGDQALAQVAVYLALAQKSDACYKALNQVRADIQSKPTEPVPMHLRNASTKHMKAWGYGDGYQHAHNFEDAMTNMECLPPGLAGTRYYLPTGRGMEKRIVERLEELRAMRANRD